MSADLGRPAFAPYAAFAAFGVFWGAWGAALPALRTQAGVGEGGLGTALLFVGLGALPSMAVTGRAVDRFGLRVVPWLLAALAAAGLLITTGADAMAPLVIGMLVVGATSGAADVAVNTLAGRAEHAVAKPLITRSHGLFSVGVVVASLATGALLGAGLSLPVTFSVVALVMLALATAAHLTSAPLRIPAPRIPAPDPVHTEPTTPKAVHTNHHAPGTGPAQPTAPKAAGTKHEVPGTVRAQSTAPETVHTKHHARGTDHAQSTTPEAVRAEPGIRQTAQAEPETDGSGRAKREAPDVVHAEPATPETVHAEPGTPGPLADPEPARDARVVTGVRHRTGATSPLLVVGLVAALAYAIENAHQSWGALMLTDVFTASPQLAAAAPATFAATAALTRLSLAPFSRSHPAAMLVGGGALATAGSAVLATAPSAMVALAGLVLAALGTATLFPTLLSRSLRDTDPAQHGHATSAVAATAYLGFLFGPAYVGLLADHSDLRGALAGVAALAAVFTLAAAPISAWAAKRTPATTPTGSRATR